MNGCGNGRPGASAPRRWGVVVVAEELTKAQPGREVTHCHKAARRGRGNTRFLGLPWR